MTSLDGQTSFNNWLDITLSQKIPSAVLAFSFNLSEPWSVEIVGTDRFDESDPDWACNEIFRPEMESFEIRGFPEGIEWGQVLDFVRKALVNYLNRPSAGSSILRHSKGIGLGFVDGNLEIVPTNNKYC